MEWRRAETEDDDKSSSNRISRLARTVARVESRETFLSAVNMIQLQLAQIDNQKYVQKSFMHLATTLADTFKGLSSGIEWKDEGVEAFASLLVAMNHVQEGVSTRIPHWIIDLILKKGHSARSTTLFAIHDVFLKMIEQMDMIELKLLPSPLYKAIEKVDVPQSFKVLSALFVAALERLQDWSNSNFPDFVDVVIGWMVDETMKEDQSEFCADILLLLKPHFLEEPSFPKTLINQILDDMEDALLELTSSNPASAIKRVLLLAKAFVAMLRTDCVREKVFVNEGSERMIGSALKVLNGVRPSSLTKYNMLSLLGVVSEAISLSPGLDGPFTRTFIKTELECLKTNGEWKNWNRSVFGEIWEGICVWVEGVVSVTQLSEDTLEVCATLMGLVDEMKTEGREMILLIHALLRTRNVALLKKVYEWHLMKRQVVQSTETTLFILAGISDIAVNRSGSILSLWALQPPIFELLMDLAKEEKNERVHKSILGLLRSHCTIHSHFISSITTTGSFASDSPGARFLPSLMEFWIEQLEGEESLWTWEWLLEFLKSSSTYAPLLLQTNPKFFGQLMSIVSSNSPMKDVAKDFLTLLTDDPNYSQLKEIQELVEEACVNVLNRPNISKELQKCFEDTLRRLSTLLVSEKTLPLEFYSELEDNPLTPTEFNQFLLHLISSNEPCEEGIVHSAVYHLIRSKLRTPFGKPQELFGQIQSTFKKRSEQVALWKLQFMFLLEKAFNLWIHGSSAFEIELPQTIQSFYITNKAPCMEWLKRIRGDLVEASLQSKDFATAFFNASSAQDQEKASVALFLLNDSEGVKGMGQIAAWHYLKGNFQKALEILLDDESETEIKTLVQKRASAILTSVDPNIGDLRDSSLDDIFMISVGQPSLIEIQLEREWNKKELKLLDTNEMGLWTLLKICHSIRWSPELKNEKNEMLATSLSKQMLKHGNVKWIEQWLSRQGIDWQLVEKKQPFSSEFIRAHQKDLEIAAESCLLTKKADIAAWIFQQLLQNTMLDNNSYKSHLIVKIGSKMRDFPELLDSVLKDVCWLMDRGSSGESKGTLESLYEKALHFHPSDRSAWFAFGNFNYEFPQWDENSGALKDCAVEAYSNFLRLTSMKESDRACNNKNERIAMSRILSLHREGHAFDAEEVIVSDKWLDFLPEVTQIPSLRSHFLRRFPRESSLHFLAHDSSQLDFKAPLKRKGLFEPRGFLLTEVSDEPLLPMSVIDNVCGCSNPGKGIPYTLRSPLHISEEIKTLGRELLRIGTSLEELWSWNLQRVLIDWSKRVSSLKKDMARDPDPRKVTAYIQPVVTFLQELWVESQKAESPSELSFLIRNAESLPSLLRNLSNCTSVEAVIASFERLLFHVETFDSFLSYKCQLSHLSPKLANFQVWSGKCTVWGISSSVSLVSIHPVVYSLNTKTKPKKIRFRGSNGKTYEYLVKGNENLNVDSGVMQFLTLSRNFLDLPTWTYAITPLGKRGGLIEMVDGAIPIFLLYKKFLQRNNSTERTSEMYWRQMNALGYSDRSNPAGLKEVFLALQSDTPKELISRELLLCAKNLKSWYSSVKGFTRDCGVSSAIGYLLGIGDRHLDNILVDLHQGKLVHVDFSLMFGKGMALRVPEVVPFRLTQNFSTALQYPGPQGAYSIYLEESLEKFQKNDELSVFSAKTIAFSAQLEEDCPVNPRKILLAEINAALVILKLRHKNVLKTAQLSKTEIVDCTFELDSVKVAREECRGKVEICEKNIEKLTVALSVLKEAQTDPLKLTSLRSECHHFGNSPVTITTAESFISFFAENCSKKSLKTENDVQWGNSIEKLIASQLQGEVQSKFSLAEEQGRLIKGEGDCLSRLLKKLNRWRRILANLDPLICFICAEVREDGLLAAFKALVDSQWAPEVAHFWIHSPLEFLINSRTQFSEQLETAELILEEIFLSLAETNDGLSETELIETDPTVDILQLNRMDSLLKSFQQKLSGFNSNTSVEVLIGDASSVENLAQMFEGWTAWV